MKLYSDHILIGSAFQSGTLEFDERFSNFIPGMSRHPSRIRALAARKRTERIFWTTAVFISSPDWWTSTRTRRWARMPVTEMPQRCRR